LDPQPKLAESDARAKNRQYGLPFAFSLLLVLSLALSAAAAGPHTLPGDVAAGRWIQSTPEPLSKWIGWLGYWIGSTAVGVCLGIILAVAFLVRGEPRLTAFVVGVLVLRAANPLLKVVLGSPRPEDEDMVIRELAGGNGFPSGHVMGATLLFGGLFWIAPRMTTRASSQRIVQVAAVFLILVTGLGRVITGAHWPSDAIGGLLWGLLAVVAMAIAIEHSAWPSRFPR
jgi:membrane-associated phospholipid phosphatase